MEILPRSDSPILGIVLWARHGDRRGFYQDPLTYTPSATSITPTGEVQEFQLGTILRANYLDPRSPNFIGVSELFNQSQVLARADAGGEGGVIFDSSIALLQGLFPPTLQNKDTLANGSTILAPLGGYQYVPIESVEPNQDVSLEGFTSCPNLDAHTAAFYNSSEFLAVANASQPFLSQLPPFLDGRSVSLVNMWNIFDFMNVQSIHNATFAKRLPPTFLAQARALANFHEYGVFSDPNFSGIGNIASRTVLPSLLNAFQRIANASDPLKLHYSAISYKPFLSLFNQTGVTELNEIFGIVNYAAAVVFEVRQSPTLGPVLRFKFKNGTDDSTFKTFNLEFPGWNSTGDVPLSTFVSAFAPAAINTTTDWCNICGQTTARGCNVLKGVPGPAALSKRSDLIDMVSPAHYELEQPTISAIESSSFSSVWMLLLISTLLAATLGFGVGSRRQSKAKI
ncbi:phosphoglycerate mutase-like protein [Trametopsis cervina]|nr:phosphoglycerate mutase-like protein [Trametopsis cervina]